MISSILSRLSVFNNGSVWALYLLHVIIRTALFCSLNILSDLKPHDNMQYCRWGRIKLLYKIFNIFWGKNRFNLHIIPSDLDILFEIFCTCPFHVKCWSIVKPKKSKSVTRSIICSLKFSCGIRFSMFRCLWWKIINFVFLTLSDSLFISNHICMFFNSLFILVDSCKLLQLLSIFTSNEHSVLVKFVSSANKIAWNFELAFMYIRLHLCVYVNNRAYCVSNLIPVAITCVVLVGKNWIWMGIYKTFRFLGPPDHISLNWSIVSICVFIFVANRLIGLNWT